MLPWTPYDAHVICLTVSYTVSSNILSGRSENCNELERNVAVLKQLNIWATVPFIIYVE
jgi:hypothetical protein